MSARLDLLKSSLIILTLGVPGFTQTSSDLERKYGSPVKEYEVRPGILMTATYSDDGQVCKMYVERRHFSETGFDQRLYLPPEVIIELIDELVPTELRGGKTKGGGFSRITGSLADQTYDYENVSITVLASFASDDCNGGAALIIKWKNRPCKKQSLTSAIQQSLAADGAIACLSSSLIPSALNAGGAPQLKASVRRFLL
jgi:hypothetical protein